MFWFAPSAHQNELLEAPIMTATKTPFFTLPCARIVAGEKPKKPEQTWPNLCASANGLSAVPSSVVRGPRPILRSAAARGAVADLQSRRCYAHLVATDMKCFYDTTMDAVGTCKSCDKGLSTDHAVDLGKGLACKNRCEDDVRSLIALIDNNVAMPATSQKLILGSGRAGIVSSIFFLLMGVAFLVSGIILWERRGLFPVVMGVLFIVWSPFGLFRSYSIQRTISNAHNRNA